MPSKIGYQSPLDTLIIYGDISIVWTPKTSTIGVLNLPPHKNGERTYTHIKNRQKERKKRDLNKKRE